jgi:rhamnosyltransferase
MHSTITTSFIIRTLNEEKWLPTVLQTLFAQSRLDFEVIIVDSGSTDSTLHIIKQYPIAKLIRIKKTEYNHAFAANLGVQNAQGVLVGFLSGHSVPISRTWYEDGLAYFTQADVVAVGGYQTSLPDGSIAEKKHDLANGYAITEKIWNANWISNANALYRREQLLDYPFDERITRGTKEYFYIRSGGEDYDFISEMRARGWSSVIDPVFNVYHSHGGLGRPTHLDTEQEWQRLCKKIDQKKRPGTSWSELYGGIVKKPWQQPNYILSLYYALFRKYRGGDIIKA